MKKQAQKITPTDVSEFEREQLRFFLSNGDVASILSEINPSLAWLPLLAELNLLQNGVVLPIWVERNFANLDAICEVVDNLRFFTVESARILEIRLNARRETLEPLLTRCWQLIIRHIRNAGRRIPQSEWFEVLPRLTRGDLSTEVLERVSQLLTPKLFVEKRHGWYDEPDRKIEKPTDLLSIKYNVDAGIGENEFFGAWPKAASAATEQQLVRTLTNSLSNVLADAIDVGAESNIGLSISDIDVPSVAAHGQNAFHTGFLPIVRVIAELWSRLINKSARAARDIMHEWESSSFKLAHRLALYAAADPEVGSQQAADLLIRISRGELFLTNSQVEVHRLIRGRWGEFSARRRRMIEQRIVKGPPTDWFREGADLSLAMDRYRFHLLLDLERTGIPIGREASDVLKAIRQRHPTWRDVEPEQVGFAIWMGPVSPVVGDKEEELASVSSDKLILAAKKAIDEADFMKGDPWQGLCQSQPAIAFCGIESASESERWHEWAWRPLLWAANKITDVDELNRIASLLARWPESAAFEETASGAAFWMDQVSEKLRAHVLWTVWDLIERRSRRQTEILNNDVFGTALNDPSGNLASVLLKRTPRPKGKRELGKQLRVRYEKLILGDDTFSMLARVRLSAAIAFLFSRAPKWTIENLLPSFRWESPDALAMWSARKYSNHMGSQELFQLTKEPFLELFSRPDVPEEDRHVFSDWLAVILLANQARNASYPLTTTEVRSVLRGAGHTSLSSFAHRLAVEMEGAKLEEKQRVWNETVGPIFKSSWPLDVDLQTPMATLALVQMLLATGPAFSDAATVIIPFIRSESQRDQTSIYFISQASEELYRSVPEKMLDLLAAIAGDAPDGSVYGLRSVLGKLESIAPQLGQTKRFQKLTMQATPY
jgi:hypothetical protein